MCESNCENDDLCNMCWRVFMRSRLSTVIKTKYKPCWKPACLGYGDKQCKSCGPSWVCGYHRKLVETGSEKSYGSSYNIEALPQVISKTFNNVFYSSCEEYTSDSNESNESNEYNE